MRTHCPFLLIFIFLTSLQAQNKDYDRRDYQWLQESESEDNLKWVEARNNESLDYLNAIEILPDIEAWNESFKKTHQYKQLAFEIDATQTGKYGERMWGKYWARAPFELILAKMAQPTIVNIDSLQMPIKGDLLFEEIVSNTENYDQCLVFYKRNGQRIKFALAEFNWDTKQVVDSGFQLPPAQTDAYWRDENSIYVTTNLEKPGEFGYKLRLWKRGESIEEAKVIFETNHYKAGLKLIKRGDHLFMIEQKEAFDEIYYHLKDDKLTKLNLPIDVADMTFVSGQFVVHLRSAWKPAKTKFSPGSLISIDFEKFLKGDNNFTLIAESNREQVIDNIWNTDDILIGRVLENVQSVLNEWTFENSNWQSVRLNDPKGGKIEVRQIQSKANRYFMIYTNFFESASYVRNEDGSVIKYGEYKAYKKPDDFLVEQNFATSKDGTRVPYSVMYKRGMRKNGQNPVIMTGYGGWGWSYLSRSMTPYMRWLEDGGVFVLTHIRGGGEYGPDWHEAARKSNRQNAYDDFKAVAEDLIEKNITQKRMIGSIGASNGGLLVANGFIQNPDLFGAVVIRSGSIDLELNGTGGGRGTGALGERGDPEVPEEWAYMKKISPLHTLKAKKNYPPILQLTTRNDDISDSAQTRRFHQRMKDLGYEDVYLIETSGGSHGGTNMANDNELELAFFYKNLHPKYEELEANSKN